MKNVLLLLPCLMYVVVHSNHLPLLWYSEKSCIFRSSAVNLILAFPKFLEGVSEKNCRSSSSGGLESAAAPLLRSRACVARKKWPSADVYKAHAVVQLQRKLFLSESPSLPSLSSKSVISYFDESVFCEAANHHKVVCRQL